MATETGDGTSELDPEAVYRDLRLEFARVLAGADEAEQGHFVPQCPEWTATDVFRHVVGITDDILAGRLDGMGSDPWTEAQVAARRDHTVSDLCDEWERLGPLIDERIRAEPFLGTRLTADLVTHLHDVLTAWGRRGNRDSDAVRLGLERYGPFFCDRAAEAGLPVVEIRAGSQAWRSDAAPPEAVLTGSAFELLRAFSGRRSAAQLQAMDWQGASASYLAVVTPYGLPADDVVEP